MPVIHVEMFSGRDEDTRKKLVAELTETYVKVCGVTRTASTSFCRMSTRGTGHGVANCSARSCRIEVWLT